MEKKPSSVRSFLRTGGNGLLLRAMSFSSMDHNSWLRLSALTRSISLDAVDNRMLMAAKAAISIPRADPPEAAAR
ncbi:MAG: hypothetical protein WDN49_12190 [Acetobacteraceae bacterium]